MQQQLEVAKEDDVQGGDVKEDDGGTRTLKDIQKILYSTEVGDTT